MGSSTILLQNVPIWPPKPSIQATLPQNSQTKSYSNRSPSNHHPHPPNKSAIATMTPLWKTFWWNWFHPTAAVPWQTKTNKAPPPPTSLPTTPRGTWAPSPSFLLLLYILSRYIHKFIVLKLFLAQVSADSWIWTSYSLLSKSTRLFFESFFSGHTFPT